MGEKEETHEFDHRQAKKTKNGNTRTEPPRAQIKMKVRPRVKTTKQTKNVNLRKQYDIARTSYTIVYFRLKVT